MQGVGFRWFVREEARALDLCGWVRNEPNGDVLLEVGGATSAVERLLALVRMGPPASRVTAIEMVPAEATSAGDLPTPFTVDRR